MFASPHLDSHHITSPNITSHHFTSPPLPHLISHHITSLHITSHHLTSFQVLLVGAVGPTLADLLHPSIVVPETTRIEEDEVHLILEFAKGEKWGKYTGSFIHSLARCAVLVLLLSLALTPLCASITSRALPCTSFCTHHMLALFRLRHTTRSPSLSRVPLSPSCQQIHRDKRPNKLRNEAPGCFPRRHQRGSH